MPALGSNEDLNRQLEEVKRYEQARIANLPNISDVFSQKREPKLAVYSDVVGMVPAEAWNRSHELHQHKLRQYREQKDYQIFIEEDEEDIEGERIYSSIKNLHTERFFHYYFYSDPTKDMMVDKAKLEQIEELQAMDERMQASGGAIFMNDTFGAKQAKNLRFWTLNNYIYSLITQKIFYNQYNKFY